MLRARLRRHYDIIYARAIIFAMAAQDIFITYIELHAHVPLLLLLFVDAVITTPRATPTASPLAVNTNAIIMRCQPLLMPLSLLRQRSHCHEASTPRIHTVPFISLTASHQYDIYFLHAAVNINTTLSLSLLFIVSLLLAIISFLRYCFIDATIAFTHRCHDADVSIMISMIIDIFSPHAESCHRRDADAIFHAPRLMPSRLSYLLLLCHYLRLLSHACLFYVRCHFRCPPRGIIIRYAALAAMP